MARGSKSELYAQHNGAKPTGGHESATRRRFLAGVATGGTIALSGCLTGLTGKGANTDGGTAGGTKNNGNGQIKVAAVEGSGRLFQRLINEYVEDDTGISVDVTLVPFANLFAELRSVLGTEGDAYDLIFLADIWLPQFGPDLEPLKRWMPSKYPEKEMIQKCITEGTWPTPGPKGVPSSEGFKEQLRGQVVVGNCQLFAYNESYYRKVGAKTPPETWDDVLSAGKKIDEQLNDVNGYVIRGKRGNPITTNFFNIASSKAGDMFDENWKYTWDEPLGVNALRYYVNDLKSISPEGVAAFNSDEVLARLGNGSAAQGNVWPAAASLLLKQSDVKDDIAFTICPKGKRRAPEIGTWMAGINKYTSKSKKKAAGRVISSFISKEAQKKYVELGGLPFRHDTFKNHMNASPFFNALYKSQQKAEFRPRTPLWTQLEVTMGTYLNTALTGNISPQAAMAKINDEFEELLDITGYYQS
jgi:multiple sugar transport system substrate-binding protein